MDESLRRIDKNITPQLRVIGLRRRVEDFEKFAKQYNNFLNCGTFTEVHSRHVIQEYLDKGDNYRLSVLINGNSVVAKTPLLKSLRTIVKTGNMDHLTDELYHFFSLYCGSIAHYNRAGWVATYPTVSALKDFFRRNEFGQDILSYNRNYVDRVSVIQDMCKILRISLRQEHYYGKAY